MMRRCHPKNMTKIILINELIPSDDKIVLSRHRGGRYVGMKKVRNGYLSTINKVPSPPSPTISLPPEMVKEILSFLHPVFVYRIVTDGNIIYNGEWGSIDRSRLMYSIPLPHRWTKKVHVEGDKRVVVRHRLDYPNPFEIIANFFTEPDDDPARRPLHGAKWKYHDATQARKAMRATRHMFFRGDGINMVTLYQIFISLTLLVIVILITRRLMRPRRHRRRRIYKRSRAAAKVATDDLGTVLDAHTANPDDPLVLVYNRPDIAALPAYRDEVIDRIHRGIVEATDTEEIPRFVGAARVLGVDMTPIAAVAVGTITAAEVRRDGVDAVIARAQQIANDPQNVHDPAVIKQMNDQLAALPVTATINEASLGSNDEWRTSAAKKRIIDSISADISRMTKSGEISVARADDARRAMYHMIEKGGTCSSYGGRHEADILRDVWNATSDADRRGNIILGLADAIDDGHMVCTNGRIARVLGANTTQVTMTDLKAAAYSFAGQVYSGLGEKFTADDIRQGITRVDEYVQGLTDMPEEQRVLVREECRAVFADLEVPVVETPQQSSSSSSPATIDAATVESSSPSVAVTTE